jgi:hypothetical protein
MEHNNRNQNNGSGNGFLLGVIVGVLLTLLFTTKRGRAIFKDVMEKGVEKFANLEDLMNEPLDEDFEDEEGDDFIPTEPVIEAGPIKKEEPVLPVKPEPAKAEKEHIVPAEKHEQAHPEPVKKEKIEEKPKATRGKRWFRGLRKKS